MVDRNSKISVFYQIDFSPTVKLMLVLYDALKAQVWICMIKTIFTMKTD